MTVVRNTYGDWIVSANGLHIAGPFATMAAGWRWIDRYNGEPLNPAEKRTAFTVENWLKS